MKQIKNLRQKSNDQLKNRLNDIEISLRRLRGFNEAQKGTQKGKKENPAMLWSLRKEKARILTILKEREGRKAEECQ